MDSGTITDPLLIRRLLDQAEDSSVRAIVRVPGHKDRYQCTVIRHERDEGIDLELPKGVELKVRPGKLCMILVFVPKTRALGFVVELLSRNKGVVRFDVPKKVFQFQRRIERRIDIPAGYEISVELVPSGGRGKRLKRRLLDLSSRGFSFEISASESDRYRTGAFLREIILKIHGRTMQFDAQVRSRTLIGSRDGSQRKRVGCAFLRVKPEDRDFIRALCLTHLASFAYLE